ncbi:MAG: YqgE/AlgH family protein [Flavobacteriales bacterium]|nr:YqgE/AlgH family protein [Flavobacteriales bacterium]
MSKLKPANKLRPKKGRLLISDPFLDDPFFKRSVIILTEFSKDMGSMGFILNRPLDFKLDEVMDDFPNTDCTISLGGPVEKDNIFFLHTIKGLADDDIEIAKGIYWGTNFATLKLLIAEEQVDLSLVRFFLGYAGWQTNQLEEEMKEESWFVSEANKKHIFSDNPHEMWKTTVQEMGKEFVHMANFPEDPNMN